MLGAAVFVVMALPSAHVVIPSIPAAQQSVVYVSPDYGLYAQRSDGTGLTRLTEAPTASAGVRAQPLPQQANPAVFTWPTWSPDGKRLVVSQTGGLPNDERAALALITPPDTTPKYVEVTYPLGLDSVADGLPHYALWSPNGVHLSVVAPDNQGAALVLYVSSTATGDLEPVVIGAPIYYSWSPGSTFIAIHHRGNLVVRDGKGDLYDLQHPSQRYRVPVFSSDSRSLAFVANGAVTVRTLRTGKERSYSAVPAEAALAWSPAKGPLLAVAQRRNVADADYAKLVLIDTRSAAERVLYDAPFYAYWWSPDGKKIAVIGTGTDGFQWLVIDAASGEVTKLAQFTPTRDFTTYIEFFDQFQQSHEVWSEDSTTLTFAGTLIVDGQPDSTSRAWVLDASGATAPRALAPAIQAYFVPTGTELLR